MSNINNNNDNKDNNSNINVQTGEKAFTDSEPNLVLVVSTTTKHVLIKPTDRLFLFPVLATKSLDIDTLCPVLWPQCHLGRLDPKTLNTIAGNPSKGSSFYSDDKWYLTGQDLECIKVDGCYKPIHISFYFSWILSSFGNDEQSLKNIMVLPHKTYSNFVESHMLPSTELYDEWLK